MRTSKLLFAAAVVVLSAVASISTAQPSEFQPGSSAACASAAPQSLHGSDFDNAYMVMSYRQNAELAALARVGSTYKSCLGLHELTRKIVRERNDLNTKLSLYYSRFNGCPIPAVSGQTGSTDCLNSCEYANALIARLEQSKAAADLAIARACQPEIRNQAKITSRTSGNEAAALRRWQQTGNTAYATQWQPLSEYCGVSRPAPCEDGCSMFSW